MGRGNEQGSPTKCLGMGDQEGIIAVRPTKGLKSAEEWLSSLKTTK